MEEQDRKKRLLAGKEKLAAFQRKRGKKKKSSPVDSETASEMASKGHGLQSGHSSSLIDPCDLGFTSEGSLSIDESDQGSVTEGDLTEEEDGSLPFVSLERTRLKLEKASERIRELEESVQGKQGALDELAAENALLKAHAQAGQHGNSTQGKGDAPQQQPDQDAYKYKLEEYDEVLKAKDGVIEQLTEALQASNFEKEQAQKESMAQASQLADEIHRLQQQLKQSSELLDHQLGLPAQALIEAKNEILALQNSLDVKDMEVESMTEAIRQRDVALKQLAEKYQEVSQQLSAITEQNAVLSQVSEDQEHWHGKQQQWSDMEHHLKKENAKYMAEIEALRDSLRQRDSSITELNASMSAVTSEKSARITQLEVNIGAYEKEISSLKDHISCTEGEMQQELISLKDVISKKDSTIVNFERQLAELSKACADKDASYAHLQSELHLREEEILSLKGNISSSRKEIDELLSQNDELRSANGTLSVEITNLRSDLSEKESTLQDLIQRSDSAAQQSKLRVAELERSCAEYREEINQHMDDLSLNCREINDLNQQFDQLKEECSKYREENQALKDTVTRKDSELEQLHKSLLDSSDEKEQRITHLMSEVSESTQEIGRLQKTLQSCEMEIKELTNAKDQVNSEKLKCMEEILTLKVTVSETDSRFENLKLQLETSEREHENVVSRLQAEVVSLQENVSSLQENKLCDEKALEEMKERQSVHESKISNLRSALSQKEETVVSLEGELDIKTAKVGDLESSLTRKCEELSQLQEVLSGKESGISEVTALLSQKEKHVRVLEQQIKEKDTEMLSLSQGISNTDTKLYEAQIELERKDCEMQRVVQEVAAKESDCTDLRNRLEDNTYQLEKLSAVQDQKESSIKALSADLAEKENTCRDLELELKKVKKNLQECQVDIAEKNATCESLRKELHQKDSSLSDLTITLERKQKSILDLQKCLDEATSKIAQLEKAESEKVLNLEKVLDEKEDIMTDLRFRLSDLSGQNADLDSDNKSLKENVCSLLQVEDQLRQVQNDVSNLREELAAKNTTVEESRDTIESLNLQINSLQSEYDGMLEEKKELRRLLEESKEELQRSADKLKSEKDELQNVLAVSQRDYDRIAESLAAVQAEKQKLVDHIESLQFQKLELTSSKEILMSEKEDLLVKTEEINSQLSDQSSASDTLVFEKDELLIKLDSLETENMQLCEKSAELASEKLELEKELSAKQTALSALQEQVSQLQAELKETSDHRTALQKNYDEKCQELTTIHLSLNEKTQALNALEASVESRLATSVQEAVENATQNYVRRIEELTGEIKDLKNRENEATCTQESLEQKVARLSDSWTVVEGVEAKHQAVDKVMLESGTSLGSSQSAESMESGSEERKPISPVMRGALQTSTSSSSSAQDGRLQELETEVVRLQAILHDRERTVLDSTKGATQQLKKKNEQIKGLNEKTEKQAAQIKTMKERATVMKNDLEALKVKYAALQSQLKTRGVKVTIPQKLEAAIKEKMAEINRLNEQIEIRDAQILTLNVELRKRPDEAEPSTSDAGTSGQKMEPSLNGDAENKIQRIREENSVLVEKLQLITSEHDSAYRSVKVENNILSEQLAEERKLFEKEKATFEEEKKRWELNIRSLSGRHQELYQQTATSNLDILTQLERLKAENAQFKSQVDELSTKLAIHVSRDDEVARLKEDLTKHSRNHELVKMELQAARTSLYELESRNPDVLVYRRKLDDLHATLQVTWIENEELKAQVMQLKYQLGLDAENDEAADEPDGQSNVARQIQKLKLEHAAQTEKLTNELETVKAKAKEIEIEKDSLHTKYQQEIRVKEKEHLNVLNELTRQLEHTRSVLDSLRSEYRHSQQQIQKLEDEKEAMQKSYGQAVEAMRREHQETLHRVRSQAEKSGRTVMVPLKENASADMQVRARLNLLMDEKIKLSKERDQLISERQDLILERELMLAEKMQLVADKDKLAAENAELQDQQQKLGAEGNTGLAKPEQLVCDYEKNLLLKQRHEEEMQALRENLNDGHRAEILLLKKTIISILNEEIRKQMESSEQLLQQIMGSSSHPEVTRAQQMLHAQHVGQLDQLNSRLTEHGILSIRGDETASDMQKMVRYLQQQNQELAEAKETLLERTDAHTPLDRSFAELSDQDSLDIMQRSLEHDGLTEHGDSISMHDSLEDYSEADFRAQIDVLQRENADLRRRIEGDYRNLNVVHSLKKEVVGLQAKYLSVMQRSAIHMRDIDSASQDEDSESLVTPPQREAFEPEIDWKKKYEDLTKETEMLRGRIDALTLSHQLSTKSQSVENLKARYESIMEENEVLRAKLGSYGLPTEGTPEEDSFDLQTKFEAVMKENETLRTKLDNYSMSSSSSQQRDEDWKSKFDCVLKDLDSLKPKSMSMADFGKVGGDVKQGLYELQGFYDSVVKEKEVLQVKLESVQDNAEKEFADLLTRYKQLLHKHQEVREKWKRTIEKSRKERSKLKARFVAALKEINILKQRLDRIPKGNVEETSSSSSEIEVDQPLYDEQKQQIDGLKSKVSTLQAENSAMKSEIGNLKSQAMGSLRRQLREMPESSDDVSEDVYESLQDKYTSACKEIEYLRSQLDAINGRLLDDLNSEVKGDTDSKPVHSQLAYLKAAGMGDSISESVEFMSTDPHDSDSDTSGDSLDLEMETDYEVLVQEYERLRTQGPAEIQQEYEAVLRRLNLQDVFNSPKRKALNVSDPKECKSDPISSEAQITKGSSSSIVSQRSRQQQLEGLTALPGDNMQDQTIDKQSQPVSSVPCKLPYSSPTKVLPLFAKQKKSPGEASCSSMIEISEIEDWEVSGYSDGFDFPDSQEESHPQEQEISRCSEVSSELEEILNRFDWSITENEELVTYIEELARLINDPGVRETITKELVELCRKCCALVQENESLRRELMEANMNKVKNASQDSSPKTFSSADKIFMSRLVEIENKLTLSNDKLKRELKECKNVIEILRSENENLMKENAKLASTYQSTTAKASWEIGLMKTSYEDEIEELKFLHSQLTGEASKLKDVYINVKAQNETLTEENEDLSNAVCKLRSDLEQARSSCADLINERDLLVLEVQQKNRMISDLQGKGLGRTCGDGNTGSDGSSSGHQENTHGSPSTNGQPSNGGHLSPGSSRDSSNGSGGFSPGGGSDNEGDDDTFKTLEELRKEIRQLRRKLRAKCSEIQQLQSFQRTYQSLVAENQDLKLQLSDKSQEAQNLRGRNKLLLNETKSLEEKVTEAAVKSKQEADDLKKKMFILETENRNLVDKIDKDVFKAEKEVAQLRQKYSVILQEKEALEFEYRTTSEGLERELSNLQARYDEISNENELMKAKIGLERSHAENEVFQAQVCVQDMAMDQETSQAEFQRGRDKIRKEIDDLRAKVERLKEENKQLYMKYEDQSFEYENVKTELQKACEQLEEDNILLNTDVKELATKYDYECRSREDVAKQLEELSNNYSALERVLEDVKSEMTQEVEQLKNRVNDADRECEIMSKTNEELKGTKATLSKELQDSQAWCELLEKSLKELESNLGEENILLKENLTTAQTQLENERKCSSEMQSERDELRLQYESLCKKYDLLQASHDTTIQKDSNSEVEYFRYEFNELQKKYENLVRERNGLRENKNKMALELDKLKESLTCEEEQTGSMSGEIEILKTQITRQDDRINQLTQSREELIREREKLSHALKESQNKSKQKEKEFEESQKKIKEELNVRNERQDKVHTDYTMLTQEYEKYRSNMAIIERDYKILLDKFTMLESKNLDFEQITHELAVARQRSRELEGYIDNLHKDKEVLVSEKEVLKKENERFKYENEALVEERDQAVMSKVALSSELEGMMARLEYVDNEKKQLSQKVHELQAAFDVVDDESDRQILEDRVQDYAKSEELRNLREQYKEMQRSHGELESTKEEMIQQLEDLQSRHHALQDLFDRTKQQFAGEEQSLRDEIESLKMRVNDRSNLVNAQTSPFSSHVSPESSQDGGDCEGLRDEIEVLRRKLEHMESVLLTYQRLEGLPQQVWRKEFLNIQQRYLAMLQEHSIMQRKLGRMERLHEKFLADRAISPLAVNDELIADNNRLINEKLKLENELQTLKLDRRELEVALTEVEKLQEMKTDLEARLEGQKVVFAQDRDRLQKKIAKLQSIIDENSSCRNDIEKELASVNQKYKNLISFKMDDVREFSESMNDRSQMLARLQASSSELRDLERHHRQILADYDSLKEKLEKLTRENEQNRKHNRELREEVARLTAKVEELTKEYHEAARCLAETNLELEIYRSKHRRDVYKIEDVMKRLKGNLGCGSLSPHTILSHSLFGRLSPNIAGSGHSTPRSSHESHGSSCSLTFDEDGSLKFATDDALESRHFQTVEEIGHLRSELRTRSLSPRGSYSDLESLTSSNSGRRYARSPLPFSESEQENPSESRSIQEEMSVIRDRNHQLLEERDDLVVRLREQEDIVMRLQKQLKSRDPSENRLVELFNHQLMMLRQQRDHLMHRLEEDRERDRRVIELIREKGAIEERFRQERDDLRKKLHEKEMLTKEQRNRISQMEKYIRKQQQLEDLLAQKEQLENELTRQAFHYESEMSDIQRGISERRIMLKPDSIIPTVSVSPTSPRVQFAQSPSEQAFFPPASYALAYEYPRPSAVHSNRLNDQQTQRLSRMKSVVERRYKHAIEKLREELKHDSRRYDISH